MDKNEKAIEKIKKCLALANSTNPHEAAGALRHAQNLMRVHGITSTDVNVSGISEVLVTEPVQFKPKTYINILLHAIDKAFGVISHYTSKLCERTNKLKRYPVFVGQEQTIELASYAYDVCMRAIKTARREHIRSMHGNCKPKTRESRADAYCNGFATAIGENVAVTFMDEDLTNAINEYKKRNYSEINPIKLQGTSKRIAGRAREHLNDCIEIGYRDGQKVSIHRPVNGAGQGKLSH
ncbi:DUF7168 domain-containing protein [Vibrio owensii]|uniref:DUF7168 domain-containing protein n=1 Tax=Vibrio owensii TaxID=696485 RepID=UPI0018F142ED